MKKFEIKIFVFSFIMTALIFAVSLWYGKESNSFGASVINRVENPSSSAVTVATATSTEVASANVSRKYLKVWNTDTNDVWCKFGETATTSEGIYIAASGGSYEVNLQNLFIGALNCYSDSATSTLTLIEG
jgi:hypothetical protein